MSEKASRKSAKIWSPTATKAFLQCTAEAYQAAGTNKKGVHKKIAAALNEILRSIPNEPPVTDEQIRCKYDSLRKQWMQWQSLRNKTGAGWDPSRNTISGSNEWWEDRVKEFGHSILKYKRGPIEEMEMLQLIYEGTHATGSSAFNPAATQQESPVTPQTSTFRTSFDRTWPAYDLNQDYQEMPSQYIPPVPPFTEPSFNVPPPNYGPSSNPQRYSGSGSTSRGRRRRNENEEKLNEIIDSIHERHVPKRSHSGSESPVTPNSWESTANDPTPSASTYSAFIARLSSFDDIPFSQALSFLRVKENRELFDNLDDNRARSWLQFEVDRMNHRFEYERYVMKKGGSDE